VHFLRIIPTLPGLGCRVDLVDVGGAAIHALLSSDLLILAESKCDGQPAYTVDNRVKRQIINSLSLEARVL
jgi:hypothetical protein